MKPQLRIANVEVDTSRFDAAVRIGLRETKLSLAEFMRARMFFLLVLIYVLMPPRNVQTQRVRVANYLQQTIGDINAKSRKTGKRIGRSRLLRRVHLIVQARNAKEGKIGLYGKLMREAAGSFMRRSVGSVGYLKSGVVKALRIVSPGFNQFGGKRGTKKTGIHMVPGNAAAYRIAAQYQAEAANVAMHRGTRATYRPPEESHLTSSSVNIVAGVADSQVGKVDAMYTATARQAFADAAVELERHLGLVVENAAMQMGMEKR